MNRLKLILNLCLAMLLFLGLAPNLETVSGTGSQDAPQLATESPLNISHPDTAPHDLANHSFAEIVESHLGLSGHAPAVDTTTSLLVYSPQSFADERPQSVSSFRFCFHSGFSSGLAPPTRVLS